MYWVCLVLMLWRVGVWVREGGFVGEGVRGGEKGREGGVLALGRVIALEGRKGCMIHGDSIRLGGMS